MGTESLDLEHSFGQQSVVLFHDLRFVGWPVKGGRIVVDILDVNGHHRVVLVEIVRCDQPQFVL